MSTDYKVDFMSEERIERIGVSWHRHACKPGAYSFNIVEFVTNELVPYFAPKDGLKIEFFDREFTQDDPAYVSFKPRTLHVDRQIWRDALKGESYARVVIAHEVGHLLLHDGRAQAFSNDPSLRIRFSQKQYSAEWQANCLAGHLLIPDDVIRKFNDEELLIGFCGVTRELARNRMLEFNKRSRCSTSRYTGDACSDCGSFSMIPNGVTLKCDICGKVVEMSLGNMNSPRTSRRGMSF
jgi:hypothetical protein